jgi:hypothetical protein
MDTAQLQLILDALKTATEAGADAFVWWLVLDKAVPVVCWLITLPILIFAAVKIIRTLQSSGDAVLCEFRDMLGIGTPGALYSGERIQVIAEVRELIRKSRATD